jgi:hypothetical protein
MYILYLDEAGDPGSWNDSSNFVIGGVAVYEGQVYHYTAELDKIQQRYFPGIIIGIPFHGSQIRAGKGQFRSLGETRQNELLGDLYKIIGASPFPNLVAFATTAHISYAKNPDQVLHDVFQDICQRFNTFLLRLAQHGRPEKGLLIIDRAHEDHYRRFISEFQKSGTQYGYLGNIIDIPYFAGLQNTRMLQLADLCAYATYRRYENNDLSLFNMIADKFDNRSPKKPDGLKHFTTNKRCTCEACCWR